MKPRIVENNPIKNLNGPDFFSGTIDPSIISKI
jgi:hypothetical protein